MSEDGRSRLHADVKFIWCRGFIFEAVRLRLRAITISLECGYYMLHGEGGKKGKSSRASACTNAAMQIKRILTGSTAISPGVKRTDITKQTFAYITGVSNETPTKNIPYPFCISDNKSEFNRTY